MIRIAALSLIYSLFAGTAFADENHATSKQPAKLSLHPLLQHAAKPIDAEKNARATLLRFRQFMKEIDWGELGDLSDELRLAKERPPANLQTEIRDFLAKLGDPYPLVVEATKSDCLSFKDPEEENLILNSVRKVGDLFVLRDAIETNAAESAQRWQAWLELGIVLCGEDSDAGHIQGLRMAEDASLRMARLAGRDSTSTEVVESMLRHLQGNVVADEAIVQALRADFHSEVLVKVLSLPDSDDPADAIDAIFGLKEPERPSAAWKKYRDQFDKRKRDTLALLKEHPSPIVKKDTLDEATELFLEAAGNVSAPWSAQKHVVRSELQDAVGDWPEDLSLRVMDYMSLFLGNEQPDVPYDELVEVRRHLAKVGNPIGKHLLTEHDPNPFVDRFFHYRAMLNGSKALLAIRLHEKRHGALPASLDALVEKGILDFSISDPYGDVFHYSRARRLLWSVGGDDGGVPEAPDRQAMMDFLRKVRPPGAPPLPPAEGEPEMKPGDIVFSIAR